MPNILESSTKREKELLKKYKSLGKLLALILALITKSVIVITALLILALLVSCTNKKYSPNIVRENCFYELSTYGSAVECSLKLEKQQKILIERLDSYKKV